MPSAGSTDMTFEVNFSKYRKIDEISKEKGGNITSPPFPVDILKSAGLRLFKYPKLFADLCEGGDGPVKVFCLVGC